MCNTFFRFTINPILKTLIVGLGSPYGNDQLGWLLIDEMHEMSSPSVTVFKSKSDGSDWFHEIKDNNQIIFIDALLSDDSIGRVTELTIEDLLEGSTKLSSSTHSISLSDSIVLAQTLGLLSVPARILAVSVGKEFSAEHDILKLIPRIARKIMDEIILKLEKEGIKEHLH